MNSWLMAIRQAGVRCGQMPLQGGSSKHLVCAPDDEFRNPNAEGTEKALFRENAFSKNPPEIRSDFRDLLVKLKRLIKVSNTVHTSIRTLH